MEFVEHVEAAFVPNFAPVLGVGDVVFLTHALPGQGGHHHVNEQVSEYWLGVLAPFGFREDAEATRQCRTVASNRYTQNTGIVLTR